MSKKQILIAISILICVLVGVIYYTWLGSTKSAFLEDEIAKSKTEITELKTEKEILLKNVTDLQKKLKKEKETIGEQEKVEDTVPVAEQELNISFREPIRVITHGGYIYPAHNTLESIKKAVDLKVYGIEIDIQITKDHIPVLLKSPAVEKTLSELRDREKGRVLDIPTLEEVIQFLQEEKVPLLLVDTYHLGTYPEGMKAEDALLIIQEVISKNKAENFTVIQTNNPDFLELIDFDKYQVAWNTFDVQEDYKNKIDFYTLNPSWKVTPEKVKIIRAAGAEVIGANLAYGDVAAEESHYATSLLAGSKYIMIDYLENFKAWAKKYNVPIYGENNFN